MCVNKENTLSQPVKQSAWVWPLTMLSASVIPFTTQKPDSWSPLPASSPRALRDNDHSCMCFTFSTEIWIIFFLLWLRFSLSHLILIYHVIYLEQGKPQSITLWHHLDQKPPRSSAHACWPTCYVVSKRFYHWLHCLPQVIGQVADPGFEHQSTDSYLEHWGIQPIHRPITSALHGVWHKK